MSLLEKTKVTHYIFIKNLYMNEYFINKKSKTHTHTQEVQESKLYSSNKKKALNVAKWRAKRKRQNVQSGSLWTLVVQIFIQNVWPLFSFTFNSIFTPVFSSFQRDKFWVDLGGRCMAPFKKSLPPLSNNTQTHFLFYFLQRIQACIGGCTGLTSGTYISIPVNTSIPFRIYHYFLYL